MAITQEQFTAQEESLRARLHVSAHTLTIDGDGPRTVRPPAPSRLVSEGRRARARRRLVVGSFAAAASVVVAGAGAGVAGGALPLPWLRADGEVGPGALYASAGTRVGDVVNALDPHFFGVAPVGKRADTWYYRTDRTAPRGPRWVPKDTQNRRIELQVSDGTTPARFTFTLTKLADGGGPEIGTSTLATLSTGEGGRGQWRRVRPSTEDGWLVLAVLPDGASAVQVRVAGTETLLPLFDEPVEEESVCFSTDEGPDAIYECAGKVTPPTLQFRLTTTDTEPPIDAITYVDKDGKYVVLGSESLVN